MKGERGEGGAGSREIFVPVKGGGDSLGSIYLERRGWEGVREHIAWGIGRKGREGGAGAGSQECGERVRERERGDEGVRRDAGKERGDR